MTEHSEAHVHPFREKSKKNMLLTFVLLLNIIGTIIEVSDKVNMVAYYFLLSLYCAISLGIIFGHLILKKCLIIGCNKAAFCSLDKCNCKDINLKELKIPLGNCFTICCNSNYREKSRKIVIIILNIFFELLIVASGALYFAGDNVSLLTDKQPIDQAEIAGFQGNDFRSLFSSLAVLSYIFALLVQKIKDTYSGWVDEPSVYQQKNTELRHPLNIYQGIMKAIYRLLALIPTLVSSYNSVVDELTHGNESIRDNGMDCPEQPINVQMGVYWIIVFVWVIAILVTIIPTLTTYCICEKPAADKESDKQKQAAEEQRQAADEQRQAADEQRQAADEQRQAADKQRQAADKQRQAADKQRQAADKQRQAADKQRQAADKQRQAADKQKQFTVSCKCIALNAAFIVVALVFMVVFPLQLYANLAWPNICDANIKMNLDGVRKGLLAFALVSYSSFLFVYAVTVGIPAFFLRRLLEKDEELGNLSEENNWSWYKGYIIANFGQKNTTETPNQSNVGQENTTDVGQENTTENPTQPDVGQENTTENPTQPDVGQEIMGEDL